jgi:hypothetical protein
MDILESLLIVLIYIQASWVALVAILGYAI